jgi:transposase InsO family protein
VKRITDALHISRSNQYTRGTTKRGRYKPKSDDSKYLPIIREIIDNRPTYGYRRVTALINRYLKNTGQSPVNHKRIYRMMRINHLLLLKNARKPLRTHDGTVITIKSNTRWCSDIFEILCLNGEKIRVVFSMDTCDREILSYIATTGGITSEMVKDLMLSSVEYRFGMLDKLPHRIQWLCDNAPGYTSRDTIAFANMIGLEVCTTPYYSPESNGMAEAFIKTFKRDYVYMHDLPDAKTVMESLPLWFEDYNNNHPHKGLKMMSPREYRERQNKLDGCPF